MTTTASQIGLPDRDIALIKSLFNLSPKLRHDYRFVDKDDPLLAGAVADVLFVNSDDVECLEKWRELEQRSPLTTPIMVSSSGQQVRHFKTLQRPLVLKRLIEALESVTTTETALDQSAETPVQEALHVLVVDDSFPLRKYMQHKLPELMQESLVVEFAANGEEALEKTKQRHYHLVFLDVVMPGLDGYKVCKQIKAMKSTCVVMLTSRKSPFDKVRGSMAGCDAYLTKPPEDARLQQILEHCWSTIHAGVKAAHG